MGSAGTRSHTAAGSESHTTLAEAVTVLAQIRRWTAEEVKQILSGPALPVTPGTAEAVSEHALILLPHLRVLHIQRKQVADRMQNLLEDLVNIERPAPFVCGSAPLVFLLRSVTRVGDGRSILTSVCEADHQLNNRTVANPSRQ